MKDQTIIIDLDCPVTIISVVQKGQRVVKGEFATLELYAALQNTLKPALSSEPQVFTNPQ